MMDAAIFGDRMTEQNNEYYSMKKYIRVAKIELLIWEDALIRVALDIKVYPLCSYTNNAIKKIFSQLNESKWIK